MLKIGLTGGIGSGKTTVAKVFERLGIPVYYSDSRAKNIMLRNDVATQIKEHFGDEAYSDKGELNRAYLAKEVFSDSEKLRTLNAMVHPAVREDFERWASQQNSSCVMVEAAILIESGLYKAVDEIIVVTAPEKMRVERVVKRDSQNPQAVRQRIAAQMNDRERLEYASYEIRADESELLIPQILKIESEIQKKNVSLHAYQNIIK